MGLRCVIDTGCLFCFPNVTAVCSFVCKPPFFSGGTPYIYSAKEALLYPPAGSSRGGGVAAFAKPGLAAGMLLAFNR